LYLNKKIKKREGKNHILEEAPRVNLKEESEDLNQLLTIHNEDKLHRELQYNLSVDYMNG
jgi:hypothetical protein